MTGRSTTLVVMVIGVVVLTLTMGDKPTPRFVWNASESVPIGFYSVEPVDRLAVTNLVVVAPPQHLATFLAERGYLPLGVPLIKRILALAGQSVCRNKHTISIDNIEIGVALTHDRRGRALPVWHGCRAIAQGEVFLMNWHEPASFDGRYFGPIPSSAIIGRAKPLWTFEVTMTTGTLRKRAAAAGTILPSRPRLTRRSAQRRSKTCSRVAIQNAATRSTLAWAACLRRLSANCELAKDAFLAASDIASNTPRSSADAALSPPASARDDHVRGWSNGFPQNHLSRTAHRRGCKTVIELQTRGVRQVFAASVPAASKTQVDSLFCAEMTRPEAVMGNLALLRGISGIVARLTARPGRGRHPTARWQDKSRRLRRGRAAEECRYVKHLARGAPKHHSLPLPTTPWNFATTRTSRVSAP